MSGTTRPGCRPTARPQRSRDRGGHTRLLPQKPKHATRDAIAACASVISVARNSADRIGLVCGVTGLQLALATHAEARARGVPRVRRVVTRARSSARACRRSVLPDGSIARKRRPEPQGHGSFLPSFSISSLPEPRTRSPRLTCDSLEGTPCDVCWSAQKDISTSRLRPMAHLPKNTGTVWTVRLLRARQPAKSLRPATPRRGRDGHADRDSAGSDSHPGSASRNASPMSCWREPSSSRQSMRARGSIGASEEATGFSRS